MFSCQRVIKSFSKFSTIPNEKFLIRENWFDGVKVDVHFILTCNKILGFTGIGGIDVPHPVCLRSVISINIVVKFIVFVDLKSKQNFMFKTRHYFSIVALNTRTIFQQIFAYI